MQGRTVRTEIQGQQVVLRQETAYPWDGRVNLTVELEEPVEFALRLRIPGWSSGATLTVNGERFDLNELSEHGYAKIERVWRNADHLTLFFPLPLVRMYASPEIAADIGLVALQRGPLVYCLESIDNAVPLHRLVLPRTADIRAIDESDGQAGLDGVVTGIADALAVGRTDWEGTMLYRPQPPEMQPATLKAIPYCLWGNRGVTTMRVWLHEQSI
ncbi:hypothetical protein [Reticulibacter mediterranei]|uniref:hypothetical protein n=1 Tax=Reticulibacter mediterranei TaxID=2778369 RepID=UPI0035713630